MKATIQTVVVIGLFFALSGCGGENQAPASDQAQTPQAQPQASPAAPAAPAAAALWCQPGKCACQEGKQIVEEKGKPQHCKLEADTTVQGIQVKGGEYSTTYFNPEGELYGFDLVKPHKFGDIECSGANVRLYSKDKVKSCYVEKPHTVNGIECEGSISVNEDGGVHRCKMVNAKKFDNFEAPAKTWITFYEGTNLVDRFEISEGSHPVDGHKCKGYFNYMHKNGKVRKCKLAEDEKIEGKAYKEGDDVCFDEAGKVVECSTMSFTTV